MICIEAKSNHGSGKQISTIQDENSDINTFILYNPEVGNYQLSMQYIPHINHRPWFVVLPLSTRKVGDGN